MADLHRRDALAGVNAPAETAATQHRTADGDDPESGSLKPSAALSRAALHVVPDLHERNLVFADNTPAEFPRATDDRAANRDVIDGVEGQNTAALAIADEVARNPRRAKVS